MLRSHLVRVDTSETLQQLDDREALPKYLCQMHREHFRGIETPLSDVQEYRTDFCWLYEY